jgi:hypothetical protein
LALEDANVLTARFRIKRLQWQGQKLLFNLTFLGSRLQQWKGSNRKQSITWQHVSQIKATAFYIW